MSWAWLFVAWCVASVITGPLVGRSGARRNAQIAPRDTLGIPRPSKTFWDEVYLFEIYGGCSRTRTYGPLIKSQLLYQLSYAPAAGRAL